MLSMLFQRYLGIILTKKTTTLAEEISFCEKYVYLYQMRYPDQFAYKFEIETIADVEIPKFIIQPLVENYFVHGIDYQRQDNAIRSTPTEKAKNYCGCCG